MELGKLLANRCSSGFIARNLKGCDFLIVTCLRSRRLELRKLILTLILMIWLIFIRRFLWTRPYFKLSKF